MNARRRLVAAARADRPTPSDRARIRAGIVTQLAAAALPEAAPSGHGAPRPASPPVAPGPIATGIATGHALAGGVVIAAVAFATGFATGRGTTPPVLAPMRMTGLHVTWSAPAESARVPVEVAEPAAAPEHPHSPPTMPPVAAKASASERERAAPVPPSRSTLADETALLRDAQSALQGGDPKASLERLDVHAARFPNGVLREERMAQRVLALCAAGRLDEARAEADRFLSEAPSSIQAERVRGSCALRQRQPAER